MRTQASDGPLTVQAIAGTHVVVFGIDHDQASMPDVRGFGIERLDHTEGEHRWLPNRLRFAGVGNHWTTDYNPLQTFLWGDYTAKPDHDYTYLVHSMVGPPGTQLAAAHSVSLLVQTAHPDRHNAWFNRGVISSQAYAQRFGNRAPGDVANNAAWRWLSRGLEEALLAFIGRAVDARWELHGAFYEFQTPAILSAFKTAAAAGATVRLVVDGTNPKNQAAVASVGIDGLVETWRMNAQIPHNKFVVASQNGVPVAVWTGSTNITDNGIFGQSNVGHVVDDPGVASQYIRYWQQLTADPTYSKLNDWVDEANPLPDIWPAGTSVVFSPRTKVTALDRYANLFGGAQRLACGTFPFTLDSRFGSELPGDHAALRWLLFEDAKVARAAQHGVTDPKTTIVGGASLPVGGLAGWTGELRNQLSHNVEYIHSKYLLIDPLSDDPIVVTGSANFSVGSTQKNDENMLVVRGEPGLAEIYLTEFMRLFAHYRFRFSLGLTQDKPTPGPEMLIAAPIGLDPTDGWWPKYFTDPGRIVQRQRLAGTESPG